MFSDTGWTYDTSSGAAATYGEDVEFTMGQVRFYVKSPDNTVYKVIGTGVGGGFGASVVPFSVTISDIQNASAGTALYGAPGVSQIGLDDLSSLMVIYSLNGIVGCYGGAGCIGLFVHLSVFEKIKVGAALSTGNISLAMTFITAAFKSVCFFAGQETASLNLGADITGTLYWISSSDPV
jgi:hypothetical protein